MNIVEKEAIFGFEFSRIGAKEMDKRGVAYGKTFP